MLPPSKPGVRVAVGISRSGKTYGIRADVLRAVHEGAMPIIVIDRMHEWTSFPRSLTPMTVRVNDVRAAAAAIEGGARLAIVHATIETSPRESIAACEWACATKAELRGVCFNEAHVAAPSGRQKLAPAIAEIAGAWAHYNAALWADSQSVWKLHPDLHGNATELRLYAMGAARDFAACREIGTPELAERVREAGQRLSDGEPGWHVRLGVVRLPPYELTRRV